MITDKYMRKYDSYTMEDLRDKLPIYDQFYPEKIIYGSHEYLMDQDPPGTTNQNLHMRFYPELVVKREDPEFSDRKYTFIGTMGTNAYSTVETFIHDEEDTSVSEIP